MMNRRSFLNIQSGLVLAGAFIVWAGAARAQPTTPGPKPELKPPAPTMICRVDPRVTGVNFAIVKRTGRTTGVISVTGVVTNRGSRDYESEIQQQSIQIFENGVLKHTKPFQYLNPNGQEFIVYQRNWNTAANAQGSNPPSYRVRIVYSDDVLTDDNLNNNDCDLTNNVIIRSGDGINALF